VNYLGHLFFSKNDTELMLANLYGDFVKGSNLEAYTESVQTGIRLHRSIDNFIDTHPDVLELKRLLYEDLPKVSGIADQDQNLGTKHKFELI
jgi:acyl carrier protein phosphodiesterase